MKLVDSRLKKIAIEDIIDTEEILIGSLDGIMELLLIFLGVGMILWL